MDNPASKVGNATVLIAKYLYRTWENDEFSPSPCVSVCLMDSVSHFCDGCFRTMDEIATWSGMDEGARRAVWHRLAQRASDVVANATPSASPPENSDPN